MQKKKEHRSRITMGEKREELISGFFCEEEF
jgi:hypothetical protein